MISKEHQEFLDNYWKNILGFKPEKEFNLNFKEEICPNCQGSNIVYTKSPAWRSKYYCNNCKHHIYVIISDKMSGVHTDSIAVDERESIKFMKK